jgi:hypothetical protein
MEDTMESFTLIDGERSVSLRARVTGGRVLLEPAAVREALGWELHEGLLCNDAMCIRVEDEAALVHEGGVDLEALARALDRALAVDVDERAACLGGSARERSEALASQLAPDFRLPDLAGRAHTLSEHRGAKILLVAWASW